MQYGRTQRQCLTLRPGRQRQRQRDASDDVIDQERARNPEARRGHVGVERANQQAMPRCEQTASRKAGDDQTRSRNSGAPRSRVASADGAMRSPRPTGNFQDCANSEEEREPLWFCS